MDLFVDFLLEAVLQIVGDCVVDGFAHSRNPSVKLLVYCIICALAGILLGVISLLFHRQHVIRNIGLRLVFTATVPFVNGLAMASLGHFFTKHRRSRSQFEHFWPAFMFSTFFGLIRLLGGH
jgi:hypothetical protein